MLNATRNTFEQVKSRQLLGPFTNEQRNRHILKIIPSITEQKVQKSKEHRRCSITCSPMDLMRFLSSEELHPVVAEVDDNNAALRGDAEP